MANANVVLKISSDVGNAITGVKSFIDIVGMATRVIIDFAKENDKFANAFNRATIDIKEADDATAGLIDTTQLYVQQQKLANAGLYLTEKQYRAVAVAAAEQGKITGDSTAEFLRLTEALTKGSPEAFRALGMDIKMTNGLMSAQSDILDALVRNYGDVKVKSETFSEGMYALGNNLSTTTGHLWNNIAQFTGLNTALNTVNEALADNNRAAEAGIGFWDAMAVKLGAYNEGLVSLMQPLADAENAIRRFFNIEGIGFITSGQIDMLEDSLAARQAVQDKHDAFNAKRAAQQKKQRDRAFMSSHSKFLAEMITGGGKSRSGGGGGRSRKEPDPLDFVANPWTEEEEQAMREAEINDLLARQVSPRDEFGSDQSMYAEPENMMGSTMMATGKTEFQIQDEEAHAEAIKLRAEAEKTAHDSRMKYLTEYGEAADKEQRAYADRWNMNTEHGKTWAETWTNSIDTIDAKAAILQTSFGGFQKIVTNMVSTLMKGDRMTVKAMANMVKGVTQQIAVEAQVRAIMSLAMAAFEAASSWGASPRIAQFLAAAGQFQATAIVALAVSSGAGAVAGRRGSGSRRPTGVMPQTSADMSPSMGNQGDRMVNVNVFLEGDADSLFRVVSDKNQEKKMAGESGI